MLRFNQLIKYHCLIRHINTGISDSFGRQHTYLRISLTEKCNLRCQYCMPCDGIKLTEKKHLLTLEERKVLIELFYDTGFRKFRFTGGEPTISNQLIKLISYTNELHTNTKTTSTTNNNSNTTHANTTPTATNPLTIGITTNGIMLINNTNYIKDLVTAGLTSINISLDTLSPTTYNTITRRNINNIIPKLLDLIYTCISYNIHVKINCVLLRGINTNISDIISFIELTRKLNIDIRFIELMPFDGNQWNKEKFISYNQILNDLYSNGYNILPIPAPHIQPVPVPDSPSPLSVPDSYLSVSVPDSPMKSREENTVEVYDDNNNNNNILLPSMSSSSRKYDKSDTTKWYHMPGYIGRVGFITTMTDHFCSKYICVHMCVYMA